MTTPTTPTWTNQLHFGDNLPILRKHIPNESVDLIYLDPPFNSNATYNVLFRENDSSESATHCPRTLPSFRQRPESVGPPKRRPLPSKGAGKSLDYLGVAVLYNAIGQWF